MKTQETFVRKLIELMGFDDYTLEVDETYRRGKVFIHSHPRIVKEHLPTLLESLNYLAQLTARKADEPAVMFDINNYQGEREKLIADLARAAARKAVATNGEISLPSMNAYERRLIHVELATHPGVRTESVGLGRGRYVVIKPILEGENRAPSRVSEEISVSESIEFSEHTNE